MDYTSLRILKAALHSRREEQMRTLDAIEQAVLMAPDDATDAIDALVQLAYRLFDPIK